MKKFLALLLVLLFIGIPIFSSFAEVIINDTESIGIEETIPETEITLDDISESVEEEIITNNESENILEKNIIEYDYEITLDNLYMYSIVALNDATINQHIRGSIWVGGTVTGQQYIDDGSINGTVASDSYTYLNDSQLVFRGRTSEQDSNYYFLLSAKAVENTQAFWIKLMNDLPNGNETFIYLPPDENGYVDARLWNYQSPGGDEEHTIIKKVYWTNATRVDVGGLAGHLIAPYADVFVSSSNNCGSIVGWNIYTEGEQHINYYTFARPKPEDKITPSPTPPTTITVTKTLTGNMWHIRCDIMDTTTFKAGGGIWKTDVISNPKGITNHEGHRSNKCGDAEHWVIWVDTEGNPYRMDEVKSGATGGTLPTVVYKPRYNLTTEEIQNMTPDDSELVYKYSQNFIDPMPWTDIKIGERLYWTTSNGEQIWYHSGIPYESEPNFMLFIDGTEYPIVAGGTVEVSDLAPGIHEITEDPDARYYLGTVSVTGATMTKTGEWSIQVEVDNNAQVEVEWPNVVITPIPTNSPTPPPTPNITPTPTPTPTPTMTPTPTPRVTPSTVRPTPQPGVIPPTGDAGFMIPLIVLICSVCGIIGYIIYNKKSGH